MKETADIMEPVATGRRYEPTWNGSTVESEVFISWGDMDERRGAAGSIGYQATAKATIDVSATEERRPSLGNTWIEVGFSAHQVGADGSWNELPHSDDFCIERLRVSDVETLAVLFAKLHKQLVADGVLAIPALAGVTENA